jgi:hypothetical protein
MNDIIEYKIEVPLFNHLIFLAAAAIIESDEKIVKPVAMNFGPFVLSKIEFLSEICIEGKYLYVGSIKAELQSWSAHVDLGSVVGNSTYLMPLGPATSAQEPAWFNFKKAVCNDTGVKHDSTSPKPIDYSPEYHFFIHKGQTEKNDNLDINSRIWAMLADEDISDLEYMGNSSTKPLAPLFDKLALIMPQSVGRYLKSLVPVGIKLKSKIIEYFADARGEQSITAFARRIYGSAQLSDCLVVLVADASTLPPNYTSEYLIHNNVGRQWRLNKLILAANSIYFQKRILMASAAFAEKARPDIFIIEGPLERYLMYDSLWQHMYGMDVSARINLIADEKAIVEFVKIIQFLQVPSLSEYFDLDIEPTPKA